jgi:GH15 family glucan-1,4-alpha-glucosidase
MGRPVILGNGALTVGLNEHGLVHDFYYPYVGLDNLTTARSLHHSIGIWIDGRFSWVDDGSWQTIVDFEDDALISSVTMQSNDLQVEISFKDFVDPRTNVFCRRVTIKNQMGEVRDIRLFMHQVFQISNGGRADTALYEPHETYILDYKGRCILLMGGITDEGKLFDQFAVGNYGFEGKEGTFRDAEDGELSGSAVEHGGVDSVIRFQKQVAAHGTMQVDYWVIASDSQQAAEAIHIKLKETKLAERIEHTRAYWQHWLNNSAEQRSSVSTELQPWLTKSLLIIKAHIDKRGGIIASCDSSIYNYGRDYYSYVWPRDGAYALWPLIRLGYGADAKRFFSFCADIMHPDGYMMHKYQPDRAIGSTWHPLVHGRHTELAIQEDETAIVLFMMGEYYDYCSDEEFIHDMYETFIRPTANFMSNFVDKETGLPHASYDLWEEKFMTHTYTTAVVYRALKVAARFAELFNEHEDSEKWKQAAEGIGMNAVNFFNEDRGNFIKGYLMDPESKILTSDTTLDMSSAYSLFTFGYPVKKEQLFRYIDSIEKELLDSAPIGGVPRYEYDHYFASTPACKGNPWFVTTLWLAQYYIRIGMPDKAMELIQWCIARAAPSGALAEQVDTVTGYATSVSPLVWSHAELANTILDIAANK